MHRCGDLDGSSLNLLCVPALFLDLISFSSLSPTPALFPGRPESVTLHINNGRVTEGQKSSYSVGDFVTIECYAGYTLHGEARIQYIGENQWSPGVPTCQLSEYARISSGMKTHVAEMLLLGDILLYSGEII